MKHKQIQLDYFPSSKFYPKGLENKFNLYPLVSIVSLSGGAVNMRIRQSGGFTMHSHMSMDSAFKALSAKLTKKLFEGE